MSVPYFALVHPSGCTIFVRARDGEEKDLALTVARGILLPLKLGRCAGAISKPVIGPRRRLITGEHLLAKIDDTPEGVARTVTIKAHHQTESLPLRHFLPPPQFKGLRGLPKVWGRGNF